MVSQNCSMRYSNAFSMIEVLICILIISILSAFIIKPYTTKSIALRSARFHIQMLQQQINQATYEAFIQKQILQSQLLQTILYNGAVKTKLFSLTLQKDKYILQIGKESLSMPIRTTNKNNYVITCNPSQLLCRQLYHRKYSK